MARKIPTILEDCLQRLDRGEDLVEVLADYPDRTEELKPLLLVAMASRTFPIPIPSQTAQRLGRNQMLAEMNSLELKNAFRKRSSIPVSNRWITGLVSQIRTWGLNRLAYSYRLATVLLVLLFSGGFFTLNASASSQPGDLLYSLKLGLERAGLVVPEEVDLPEQILAQYGLEKQDNWDRDGQIQEIQGGDVGPQESFPGSDQGAMASAGSEPSQREIAQQERDLREAEREEEQELKEAEKEEEQDLKEVEKEEEQDLKEVEKEEEQDVEEIEEEQDLKEVEKDLKETEREAEKDLRVIEKELKKSDKQKDK